LNDYRKAFGTEALKKIFAHFGVSTFPELPVGCYAECLRMTEES
jgi:hypothetical protein